MKTGRRQGKRYRGETEIAACVEERKMGGKEAIFEERMARNCHDVMNKHQLSANALR